MPELPEVETVRRILSSQIIGKTIVTVNVLYERMLENCSKATFIAKLSGEVIRSIYRYGKYLVFIFDKVSVITHLRMEGKFFLKPKYLEDGTENPIEKHEHIIFTFTDNVELRYHDTRKFGRMALLDTTDISEIMKYKALVKLGQEANNLIDADELYNKIHTKHIPIKVALLDQENLAGLGNIYVDEVCFRTKLHPEEFADTLSKEKVLEIIQAAKTTLDEAIAAGGTTIRSYTSSLGVSGRFQQHLLVHTRSGAECYNCHTIIKKIRVGGRGTYYCPTCQKLTNYVPVVGITGIIGSGKSLISCYLEEHGYQVIDADQISRSLLAPDSLYLEIIIKELETIWGASLVNTFKTETGIDRKKIAKIVFEDEEKRLELNGIIHPLVKKIIINKIKIIKSGIINNTNGHPIFIDVPLLMQAKFDDLCEAIIFVSADITKILERLRKRDDLTEEEIMKRISAQMSLDAQIKQAHKHQKTVYILDNNQTIDEAYNNLTLILKDLEK